MKNRYLLFLTLIFGLAGQVIEAMNSQVPITQEQIKQLFLNAHFPEKNLQELDTDIKNKIEPVLNRYAEKYYPGFKLKYLVSEDTWRAGTNLTIKIPYSFIQLILQNKPKSSSYWAEIGSFCHEVTHCINKDPEYLRDKIMKLPEDQRGNLTKEREERADRGVPDNEKILEGMYYDFQRKVFFKQFSSQCSEPKLTSWYKHPSNEERAQYFKERINALKTDSNNIKANYYRNPNKLHEFFGADAMPLFKPTNLARYSFSRDEEFLKTHTIRRYWQNALLNN